MLIRRFEGLGWVGIRHLRDSGLRNHEFLQLTEFLKNSLNQLTSDYGWITVLGREECSEPVGQAGFRFGDGINAVQLPVHANDCLSQHADVGPILDGASFTLAPKPSPTPRPPARASR